MKNKKLAVFAFAIQAGLLQTASAADAENGRKIAVEHNCASCHGENMNKPLDPTYPKLAGQHYDYLVHALTAYQSDRPLIGRTNAIMAAQAKPLKRDEIKDLAAYISGLPGELVTKK